MNRRSFLGLLAASTTTYFLAPKCGWLRREETGIFVPNSLSPVTWSSKTPEEILADINTLLAKAYRPLRSDDIFLPYQFTRQLFAESTGQFTIETDSDLRKRISRSLVGSV